jgi:hypothetical protein
VQKLLEAQQAKINKASEKIRKENEKIATLSEQTRKKSEELQKIAKEKGADSYDYELKAKELENLGSEIDRIANSDEYKEEISFLMEMKNSLNQIEGFKLNNLEFKKGLDNGLEYKIFVDNNANDFSSVKELEKKLNSKEFKNGIVKIKKVEFHKKNDGKVQSFPPMNIENFNWTDKSKLSKAEQKKLDKLSKERRDLAQKQAELAKKQAEIAKQQAEISRKYAQNNPWIITVDANVPKEGVVNVSADKIKYNLTTKNSEVEGLKSMKVFSDKSIKYYINGKLSTKEEMDKLNPNDIATVNVNKNVNNGKEEGEIRIQTK